MSGKRKPVLLPDLVRQSDAILEVRKRTPYITTESIPLGTKSGKTFQGSAFGFDVLSVLDSEEGLEIPKSIKVHYANDLPNYFEARRQEVTPGQKILLYPFYQAEVPGVDTLPAFLVFVKHEDRLDRFFFTADGALESREKAGRIKALLKEQESK